MSKSKGFTFTARVMALALAGCAAHTQSANPSSVVSSEVDRKASDDWERFWREHSVSQIPPKSFLDFDAEPLEIMNLSKGLLSDDIVRRWILADIRRGRGDAWAANRMRDDIVNAGVFGPPGLNGTDRSIAAERARGTVEVSCKSGTTVAAAVIAVPRDTQTRIAWADLTDFVIVQVFRATGEPCVRKLSDGRAEAIPLRQQRGELSWQLDTGDFRDDPAVGPLWYQARGWSCRADGTGKLDEICGLVRPTPRTSAVASQQGLEGGPTFESPAAKKECEVLMNAVMPFAQEMLSKSQAFFPFGATLSLDGKVTAAAGSTGESHPDANVLIALLEEGFRQGAKEGRYKATALAVDIRTIPPGKDKKQDAIQIRLDHRDGYSVRVIFPYTLSVSGSLQLEEPFAAPGEKAIFGH